MLIIYPYGGLAFLDECYEAEHLLSIEDAINNIAIICKNNGNHSIFRLDTHRNPAYLCAITNY
ncbi:DUF3791 domain-containing protein [Bacteroides caecimuris]|uniref:DUF3791 domain-containing protein n=3 Tax=Bacteroides caecimuris TaxID=1796613 RepID=UPI0008FF626C|nr:DUF3791 domain-containing protein [Bacteroides caecimuris]